jgi:hypothetical protein
MAQLVEYLLTKCEALSSNTTTTEKKNTISEQNLLPTGILIYFYTYAYPLHWSLSPFTGRI